MDVKYQVFVSSTYIDLVDERRSVIETILNMGHIPIGMEAFQAGDDSQWDYIKQRIDDCDYYVLIVAERYGSELRGKSYTQMEYEYAVEKGVPVAAFLLDVEVRKSWPSDRVEFERKKKVEKLRKICQRKLVKYWKNKDDLANKVGMALSELFRQRPRTGWIRADKMPSESVLQELAQLSEERRRLQRKVEELSSDGTLEIPGEYAWRIKRLGESSIEGTLFWTEGADVNSLLLLFQDLDFAFVKGADVDDLVEHIKSIRNFDLDDHEVNLLMSEYVKHGLLESRAFLKARDGTPTESYSLTDRGKQFLMYAEEWSLRNGEVAAK